MTLCTDAGKLQKRETAAQAALQRGSRTCSTEAGEVRSWSTQRRCNSTNQAHTMPPSWPKREQWFDQKTVTLNCQELRKPGGSEDSPRCPAISNPLLRSLQQVSYIPQFRRDGKSRSKKPTSRRRSSQAEVTHDRAYNHIRESSVAMLEGWQIPLQKAADDVTRQPNF